MLGMLLEKKLDDCFGSNDSKLTKRFEAEVSKIRKHVYPFSKQEFKLSYLLANKTLQ